MNKFYFALPYSAKVLATSLIAAKKSRAKYGSYFEYHLDFLLKSPIEEQQCRAAYELDDFLKKIASTSRYYAVSLSRNVSDMPLITKADVLANYESIRFSPSYTTVKSSGTSGVPLAVPYTQDAYQKEYAFWWYHRSFGGISRGNRVATFAGHKVAHINRQNPPFWVYNATENQMIFSSYHLSDQNLGAYVAQLNSFKPYFIHGYPSSIYLVARYIIERGIKLSFSPKMIATASETTLEFQREVIERAFNAKVFIWYGNTEYCGHITECSNHRLHVQPYHSYVRILKPDGSDAGLGEEGVIVGTNFTNYALPLINYVTNDVVRISSDQSCSCGRGGMIVDYIIGRVEDYIMLPDGRNIGRLDHLFKDALHVRNGQIEQVDLDTIVIRIEREAAYSKEIEKKILMEARARIGNKMNIIFDYVDDIPKDSNGKFRFVIQRLKKRGLNETTHTKL